MSIKISRYIIIISALLLVMIFPGPLVAQKPAKAEEKQVVNLTWKPVPGAIRYIVEIRTWWGRQVIRKATWHNRLKVSLPVGRYRMQVTGQNKFRKKHGTSNWKTIVVKPFPAPVISDISPDELKADQGRVEITITGKNFRPTTTVYLIAGEKKEKIALLASRSDRQLVFSLDTRRIGAGSFGIEVRNPSGRNDREEESIIVKEVVKPPEDRVATKVEEKKYPKAYYLSERRIFIQSGRIQLTMMGQNLEKATSLVMTREKSIGTTKATVSSYLKKERYSLEIEKQESDYLVFSVNSSTLKEGVYRFTLMPQKEGRDSGVSLTVRDPARGLASLGGLNVGIGYTFSVPLPQWSRVYHFSPAGVFLYTGYDFSGFGLPSWLGFMRFFGMEYQFSWALFDSYPVLNRVKSRLNAFSNEAGLYGFVPLKKSLRLYFHLRGGFVSTLLDTTNATGAVNVASFDFTWQAGTALRYTWRHFYFLEFGTWFQWHHFSEEPMMNINGTLMFGVRL